MISATLVGVNTFEVVVEGRDDTTHRVTLQPDYYKKLCGGTITHEWVIIQAFNFLLERESNTAILESFDLEDINDYFSEFEEEMANRLGSTR
ncbi:MAG: hypothetical protein ACC642_10175 [Pseudomonadales bacterium]